MKQRYALSKRAEMDLANIWRYTLETWSREQANKYLQGLLNACSEIAISPNFLGRQDDHVRSGYRKYPYGKHVIFYQVQDTGRVLISRGLHMMMDFGIHL